MSSQALDYIIIFGQGIIIALLGYNFMSQGRGLLAPQERIKSASQMVYAGLALVVAGAIVALIALLLLIFKS